MTFRMSKGFPRRCYEAAIMVCVVLFCFVTFADAQPEEAAAVDKSNNSARETLSQYLQLRLQNAEWKDYSKFVTWSAEPVRKCKWVVSKYSLGKSNNQDKIVTIPVGFLRVGLFCDNLKFEPESKVVIISYELVGSNGRWRVNAPIPDYPDIGIEKLMQELLVTSEDVNVSTDRRSQYREAALQLFGYIQNMPKPSLE